jgi:spermidine synthase
VVLGDARLSLQRAPDSGYTALVLDAFSSDAIPVHLLTREALALYRSKLAPHGVLLLHLSNRHLELRPVVSELARDAGWTGRVAFGRMTPAEHAAYKTQSLWAVMARDEADLGKVATDARWQPLPPGKGRLWTDDYTDIWSVLEK